MRYLILRLRKRVDQALNPIPTIQKFPCSELKTLEWDMPNPDWLINLEINNKRRTSII